MITMAEEIKFGTDGWRAKIAEGFTFENLGRVADAYGVYMQKKKKEPVIALGYDNRFMSEKYAGFVSERLAKAGFKVKMFAKAVHTPLVSFTIARKKLDGGIVITSSHNPGEYNGFKIKNKYGAGAADKETKAVEKIIASGKKPVKRKGGVKIIDMDREYIAEARKMINVAAIKKSGMKIVLDEMFGSGAGYIGKILGNYKRIKVINSRRDPSFGGVNPEPIKQNLQKLIKHVKKEKAHVGIAIDGDGDRMGVIDDKGNYLSPHKVLVFHLLHHIKNRRMSPEIVRTISGTMMLDKIAHKNHLVIYETPVGFKHIGEFIIKDRNTIGGEESGGIGFGYYLPERDGVIGNLLMLEFLALEGKRITKIIKELDEEYGPHRYDRVDVRFKEGTGKKMIAGVNSLEKKKYILGRKIEHVNRLDGIKFILADNEWLLFRFSGTEPLLRVYAEGPSVKRVDELLAFGEKTIKSIS